MSTKANWIDMTDQFTPEGIARLEKGQVLVFDYEGSRNEYKIMRIRHGKVWVKHITLYDPNDDIFSDKGLEPHTTRNVTDVKPD